MLENLTPMPRDRRCKVTRIMEQLSEADREILKAAFTDPQWNMTSLSKALRSKGISVVPDTLRSHQRGSCAC